MKDLGLNMKNSGPCLSLVDPLSSHGMADLIECKKFKVGTTILKLKCFNSHADSSCPRKHINNTSHSQCKSIFYVCRKCCTAPFADSNDDEFSYLLRKRFWNEDESDRGFHHLKIDTERNFISATGNEADNAWLEENSSKALITFCSKECSIESHNRESRCMHFLVEIDDETGEVEKAAGEGNK